MYAALPSKSSTDTSRVYVSEVSTTTAPYGIDFGNGTSLVQFYQSSSTSPWLTLNGNLTLSGNYGLAVGNTGISFSPAGLNATLAALNLTSVSSLLSSNNTWTGTNTYNQDITVTGNIHLQAGGYPYISAPAATTTAFTDSTAQYLSATYTQLLLGRTATANYTLGSAYGNLIIASNLTGANGGNIVLSPSSGNVYVSTGDNLTVQGGNLVVSGNVSGLWNGTAIGLSSGGTNANLTAVVGGLVYTNATAMQILAPGTSGYVLTSQGAGIVPQWQALSSGFLPAVPSAGMVLISDGTNWTNSTATYPLTAGLAGHLLRSNGSTGWVATSAAWTDSIPSNGSLLIGTGSVWTPSTATFPLTSPANGALLIGAGGNWTSSTYAFPTSAPTTGQVLIGSSGNWAVSSYTFASPAGNANQVLASDGTNWVNTTLTNLPSAAASGNTGKLLQSNGSTWGTTTATYPASAGSAGTLLYSNGSNWVASNVTLPASVANGSLLFASAANQLSNTTMLYNDSTASLTFNGGGGISALQNGSNGGGFLRLDATSARVGGSANLTAGGSIDLHGTSGATGGSLSASANGTWAGGSLNLSANSSAAGGAISTVGGGAISTAGGGSINTSNGGGIIKSARWLSAGSGEHFGDGRMPSPKAKPKQSQGMGQPQPRFHFPELILPWILLPAA